MSMSRKDFELLARTLKDLHHHDSIEPKDVDYVSERIATALSGHCATFQKERFIAACKPKDKS